LARQWIQNQFGIVYGSLVLRSQKVGNPGVDVVIFRIFPPKFSSKNFAFLAQTTASFHKKLIITLVFEKNVNFFAENKRKLEKIVIITSTPGRHAEARDRPE
jgi:hypothetical protein